MRSWRRPRTQTGGQQAPRPLLASATLVKQSQIRAIPAMRDWQARAWEFYDMVGELRFAAQWISSAMSRCRLYIGVPDDDGGKPDPLGERDDIDPRARIPLDELFGGPSGHAEMLSRMAMHLTVPGETYLIGFDDEAGNRRWMVASSEEFVRTANQVKIRLPESDRSIPVDINRATVVRLWRPHPRRAWEADSPVRAALSVLKELQDLSAHVAATLESRLAGAGVWVIPESATLPTPMNEVGQPLHEDPAMATLIDAMVTPLGDRDSAASVVPIIVRVPDAAAGKSQYITFSTPLDDKIRGLREDNIRRFATIMDIPAEVLTGYAAANRWNMWKISEDAVALHIEPMCGLICEALTTQYLWPALEAMGITNPEDYVVWYDSSDLVLRPNRGPEAQNLYGERLVSGAATRRANGFTDDDAPTEDEEHRVLLTQLASRGIDPVVVAPYLRALGIDLGLDPAAQPVATEDRTTPEDALPEDTPGQEGTRIVGRPPKPTLIPTRAELPVYPRDDQMLPITASAVPGGGNLGFAAVEFAAVRALELAGKRLLNGSNREWKGKLRRVDPWAIHTYIPVADVDEALEGAYALMHLCLPGADAVHKVVDAYVRQRLADQEGHDRDRLFTLIRQAGCLPGAGGFLVSA